MKIRTLHLRVSSVRGLFVAAVLVGTSTLSSADVLLSVDISPPPIPIYTQPVAPAAGYIWTPGYWGWGLEGYYWVPGTWVLAPFAGALWTPGYWGWGSGAYVWSPGYWGPRIGFYGGINYGFGYFGVGYVGGYWRGGTFNYNTAVTNVNVTNIHNTYVNNVQNTNVSHVSYTGGEGGIVAQPTAQERLAAQDAHRGPTQQQLQHAQLASAHRSQLASVNHGSPAITTTPRATEFRSANTGEVKQGAAGNTARGEAGYANPQPGNERHNATAAYPAQGRPSQAHEYREPRPQAQARAHEGQHAPNRHEEERRRE